MGQEQFNTWVIKTKVEALLLPFIYVSLLVWFIAVAIIYYYRFYLYVDSDLLIGIILIINIFTFAIGTASLPTVSFGVSGFKINDMQLTQGTQLITQDKIHSLKYSAKDGLVILLNDGDKYDYPKLQYDEEIFKQLKFILPCMKVSQSNDGSLVKEV